MGRHDFTRRRFAAFTRTRIRAFIASVAAFTMVAVLAVVGASSGSVASADPATGSYVNGVAVTMVGADGHTTTVGGAEVPVIASGENVDITVWYYTAGNSGNNLVEEGMTGKDVVIDFSGIAGSLSGSLNLAGNTVFEDTSSGSSFAGNMATLKVKSELNDAPAVGHFTISLKLTNSSASEQIMPTWTIGGDTGGTVTLISLKDGDQAKPTTSLISKNAADDTKPVDITNGAVSIPSGTSFTYTLTMTTTAEITDLSSKEISDALGDVNLAYDTGSFQARVTMWDANGVPQDGAWTTVGADTSDQPVTITAAADSAPASFSFPLSGLPSAAWHDGTTHTTIPAYAEVQLQYTVKVESDAKDTLKNSDGKTLQDQYDAIADGTDTGTDMKVSTTNTATFPIAVRGESSAQETVYLTGGVYPGKGFSKAKTTPWDIHYVPANSFVNADGTAVDLSSSANLATPIPVAYQLRANLANWMATNLPDLTGDVVISDTLPDQMAWDTVDLASGATLKNHSGSTVAALTEKTDCADVAASSSDDHVGNYCIDGQELQVNVGHDSATDATIDVDANITTFKGLSDPTNTPKSSWFTSTVTDAKVYALTNTATFAYDSRSYTTPGKDTTVYLVDRSKSPDAGIQDTTVFEKGTDAAGGRATFVPGKPATVKYTFTVNPTPAKVGNMEAISPSGLTVVDTFAGDGAALFDLTDPADSAVSVTYGGSTIDSSNYTVAGDNTTHAVTVTFDDDWAPEGTTTVSGESVAKPITKPIVVTLTITSAPIAGKKSFTLSDSAYFKSKNPDLYYWDEIDGGEVTSWGSEASVDKAVSDGGAFTGNLRVPLESDGSLPDSDKIYVYQIEVIPHGTYGDGSAGLQTLTDTWPSDMTFCGLLPSAGADPLNLSTAYPTTCAASDTSVTIETPNSSNQIEAVYSDSGSAKIDIKQGPGEFTWDAEKPLYVYAAAKINSFTPNTPIVNTIGRNSATIVPTQPGVYPLSVTKADATFNPSGAGDVSPIQDDTDARFQLWRGGSLVVDNIFLCGGQLRVDSDALGNNCTGATAVTVHTTGDYQLYEIVPPTGTSGEQYQRAASPLDITVNADGSTVVTGTSDPAVFYDYPVDTATVSVGDYVWWDQNHNGIQDADEPGIKGVALELCTVDGDGVATPATVDGKTWSTTTNQVGYYSFDGLPVLSSGRTYTVCIDRDDPSTRSALAGFAPTLDSSAMTVAGATRDNDSSTWSASTDPSGSSAHPLTSGGDHDSSLDFGFYKKPTPPGGGTPGTPGTTTSPAPTSPTTPAVTTPTTAPATTPTVPTVQPTSATGPAGSVPPTNAPATTIAEAPQCTGMTETGFEPGETVTITVTGEHGQYQLSGTADATGTVRFCFDASTPGTYTIQVLGEHHSVVRQIVVKGESASLPYTGVAVARYLTLALLLLGAGIALVLGAKRRRGHHAAG